MTVMNSTFSTWVPIIQFIEGRHLSCGHNAMLCIQFTKQLSFYVLTFDGRRSAIKDLNDWAPSKSWILTIRRFVTQMASNLVYCSWNFRLFGFFHLSHKRIFASQNVKLGELYFVQRKPTSIWKQHCFQEFNLQESRQRSLQKYFTILLYGVGQCLWLIIDDASKRCDSTA